MRGVHCELQRKRRGILAKKEKQEALHQGETRSGRREKREEEVRERRERKDGGLVAKKGTEALGD